MNPVNHIEVRERFLKFFDRKFREYAKSKGEDPTRLAPMILPSSSLVPDDPSTLFTSAGMHQFKDDFTGNLRHGTRRAATCQKCLRTPDLENVGKTARHHTFFEMLGFFSFGDYFKREAIAWIWEFYTVEMKLSQDRLRVSVYQDDDEAYEIWKQLEPSLHEKHWIYRFGENDNFWPAGAPSQGPNGVCGPCSEIFYDLGAAHDKPALKGADDPSNNGDRFMEIGNIVFTQFERSGPVPGPGTLKPLPAKNIDFGGGFERLILALEIEAARLAPPGRAGAQSESVVSPPGLPAGAAPQTTLDTSLFKPVRAKMCELLGTRAFFGFPFFGFPKFIGSAATSTSSMASATAATSTSSMASATAVTSTSSVEENALVREKRIADHIRCAVFAVADGVVPGNEKQGYILRRILRRAYRDGNKLGFKGPFLHKLVSTIVELYGDVPDYRNLKQNPAALENTIRQEEEAFDKVLARGLEKVAGHIAELKQRGAKSLDGALAFDLHSTYGLPVDVTRDELTEAGLALDEPGFEAAFEKFREESRKAGGFSGEVFEKGWFADLKARGIRPTEFLGYQTARAAGNVVGISHNEHLVDYIREGSTATVVLDKSPFYGESGGQVGDAGVLSLPGGRFVVADTKKKEDYILHVGKLESGKLSTGDTVEAIVDDARRTLIRANHSATHLMHAALRKVLGEHVVQRGSEVAPDRLRFDFTHPKAVTWDERREIERLVNEQVIANLDVCTDIMPIDKAREAGAMALFGEKYGDNVRVLSMGVGPTAQPFSRELCGGTHVRRTGDIGLFKIVSEGSTAAGVRRIEAVTGMKALAFAQAESDAIAQLGALLKTPPEKILGRVEAMQKEIRELKSAGPKAAALDGASLEKLRSQAQETGGVKVLVAEVPSGDAAALLTIMESLRQDTAPHAVLLGGKAEDKANLALAFSPDLVKRGLHAGKLVGELAKLVGGGGGGKPDHAQAGGKNPGGLAEALKLGRERISAALK